MALGHGSRARARDTKPQNANQNVENLHPES